MIGVNILTFPFYGHNGCLKAEHIWLYLLERALFYLLRPPLGANAGAMDGFQAKILMSLVLQQS